MMVLVVLIMVLLILIVHSQEFQKAYVVIFALMSRKVLKKIRQLGKFALFHSRKERFQQQKGDDKEGNAFNHAVKLWNLYEKKNFQYLAIFRSTQWHNR